MSFTIWYGLHGAATREAGSAKEAARVFDELDKSGAKYLQVVDDDGREYRRDELPQLTATEERA